MNSQDLKQQAIEVIQRACDADETRRALNSLEDVLSADGADAEAWYWYGEGLISLRDFEKAAGAFEKATTFNPGHDEAWSSLGSLLHNIAGDLEAAELAFKGAIEVNPKNSRAWSGLGSLLHDMTRLPEAAEACRKVLELDPQAAAQWNELGEILSELGDNEAAGDAFRAAVQVMRDQPKAWCQLAEHLSAYIEDYEGARDAYEQALLLDPKNVEAWTGLAEVLETLGNEEGAQLAAGKVKAIEAAASAHGLLAMDEKADAAAGFRRAIHFDRTDVHSAMKLADLSAELGDWDAAIAAMRQAIEHDPENALAWCKLGDVLTSSMQQLEDARAAYEEAIRIRPGYVEAWTGLGEALRLLDDDGGASAALRKAEELKAHDTTGGN